MRISFIAMGSGIRLRWRHIIRWTRTHIGYRAGKTWNNALSSFRRLWNKTTMRLRRLRNSVAQHCWVSAKSKALFAAAFATLAIVYSLVPYSINRQPGLVERAVNALNLVPGVSIDMQAAYNWAQKMLGYSFDVFFWMLVGLGIWLTYSIARNIINGRPEDDHSVHIHITLDNDQAKDLVGKLAAQSPNANQHKQEKGKTND